MVKAKAVSPLRRTGGRPIRRVRNRNAGRKTVGIVGRALLMVNAQAMRDAGLDRTSNAGIASGRCQPFMGKLEVAQACAALPSRREARTGAPPIRWFASYAAGKRAHRLRFVSVTPARGWDHHRSGRAGRLRPKGEGGIDAEWIPQRPPVTGSRAMPVVAHRPASMMVCGEWVIASGTTGEYAGSSPVTLSTNAPESSQRGPPLRWAGWQE